MDSMQRRQAMPDLPEEKPKELTEEQKRTEAKKQKEANDWAAWASATIPGTWRLLADKDNPYGAQTLEEKLEEEQSGGLRAGSIRIGHDNSKLLSGVYRNDATGLDIRFDKDNMKITFPSQIEYHQGSRVIKKGVIRTDADFLKKYGGGINFMKRELGAQTIYIDFGKDPHGNHSILLSATRIKGLIQTAGKEPAADIEFGDHVKDFIADLPNNEKDEINRMLLDLSTKSKLTRIAKGTHTDEKDLVESKDKIDGLPGLNTTQLEVREAGPLPNPLLNPVLEGTNSLHSLQIDGTITRVSAELNNIDEHLLEGKVALNDMKSSLNSYNEILKTPAGDLIKSPIPELETKREAEGLGRHDDPTLFHQVKRASDESANARSKLLITIDNDIKALEASRDACKQTLKTLRDDPAIKTAPVADATPEAKAEHKARNDKITDFETKLTKVEKEILSLKTLCNDTEKLHTDLPAKMDDKKKAVEAIVAPQKPARPAPA